VINREAMPIARLVAAAKTMAPIASNRISVKDMVHQAMRPRPAVAAGAWSDAHVGGGDACEDDDRWRMLCPEGASAAIHKQRGYRSAATLRPFCGGALSGDQEVFARLAALEGSAEPERHAAAAGLDLDDILRIAVLRR
jgi:hypothetical protein